MDASFEPPCLSYPQLFSFQVSYASRSDHRNAIILEASKKGEWRYGILEVDFPMETFFIQDHDRIFLSQTFSSFNKYAEANSSDICSLSLIFKSEQWDITVQNIAEKDCLQHILESITRNAGIDDVVLNGKGRGILGLDKNIVKYGSVQRKAVNQQRLDHRFLVLCPGKLFIFKSFDIKGKHVRYVTSLLGAAIRMLSEVLEFQILAPGSKTITLVPQSQEDLSSWVEALGISIDHTKTGADISEVHMKEKQSETQLTNERPLQQSSGCNGTTSSYDHCVAIKGENELHANEEIHPSAESVSFKSLTKDKLESDREARGPPQELQYIATLLKEALKKEDKEQRDARKTFISKGSSNRQSRAMVYLENALDEMALSVCSIRTTHRLAGGQNVFDTFSKGGRRMKSGAVSPLRSSWNFDWKANDEQNLKGNETYAEQNHQERDTTAAKTSRNIEVPKLNLRKQFLHSCNKGWHTDRTTNSRTREPEIPSTRLSFDGVADLNRIKDMPRLSRHANFEQTLGKTYSGTTLLSSGRPSMTSARPPSKLQLSAASENILKRYNNEVSIAEATNLSRNLQTGHFPGKLSHACDSRQNDKMQEERVRDSRCYPYLVSTSSTSEDEDDDGEDNDDEKKGNENETSLSRSRHASSRGHPPLLDAFPGRQDGDSELERSSESRKSTADIKYVKGRAYFDENSYLVGSKSALRLPSDSSHRNAQDWQDIGNTNNSQHIQEGDILKRFNGTLDTYTDDKKDYSGMITEPVPSKSRENSEGNKGVTSCIDIHNKDQLQDPIYDSEFVGPQIINRRQRFSHHDNNDDGGMRKNVENIAVCINSHSAFTTPYVDTREKLVTIKPARDGLPSSSRGDETSLLHKRQEGSDFSVQNKVNFPSQYRNEHIEFTRHIANSSFPSQRGSHLFDHGLADFNELPKLVNRISKITATVDPRDVGGHHNGGVHPLSEINHADYANHNMQPLGSNTNIKSYQQHSAEGSSVSGKNLLNDNEQRSSNSIRFDRSDGHVRWSTSELFTPLGDHGRQRQRMISEQQ
ncbi:hypothetical protein KP509_01G054200 [Ceratopteris richardii]|uniref:PH domain-containing protein n=1 Tax=Ceratopteris richardii TaxID=49495 RepID=A0A8T2VD36_CERRI|nr:hypothetical protein KP509_01G054200 [Ceratopteris richardii]KAH7446407.1 hypothetical protein KP509_01G054200 [Ceratopteris richardii]